MVSKDGMAASPYRKPVLEQHNLAWAGRERERERESESERERGHYSVFVWFKLPVFFSLSYSFTLHRIPVQLAEALGTGLSALQWFLRNWSELRAGSLSLADGERNNSPSQIRHPQFHVNLMHQVRDFLSTLSSEGFPLLFSPSSSLALLLSRSKRQHSTIFANRTRRQSSGKGDWNERSSKSSVRSGKRRFYPNYMWNVPWHCIDMLWGCCRGRKQIISQSLQFINNVLCNISLHFTITNTWEPLLHLIHTHTHTQ